MKRDWRVEINHEAVSSNEYNQLVDEWAGLVYSYFCQLPQNQTEAPVTFNKKAGAI